MKRKHTQQSTVLVAKIGLVLVLLISQCHGTANARDEFTLIQKQDLGNEIGHPGEIHLGLNPLIGMWNMDISVRNGPDDQDPQKLQGTMQRRWVLKGRFIEERTTEMPEQSVVLSEFRGRRPLMQAGLSYHGVGYLGYDRLAGMFEHIWIHDDSTRMYYSRGRYDKNRSTLILRGTWTDPYDGTIIFSRNELTITNDTSHKLTRYISDTDTGEFRDLEIVFTRTQH